MVKKLKVGGITLTVLFTAASLLAGIPTEGIVAQYMFSGNIADSSGNGNKGRDSAIEPSTDRFGNENRSYRFNGSSSYILVDSAHGLPSGNHAKSISLWFKSGTVSPTSNIILAGFGSRKAARGSCFQISHDVQGWRINGYGDNYDWRTKVVKPDYLDTLWHHCALTYDGTNTKVYFDGNLKASTASYRFVSDTERIVIGMEIDLSGWNFKGNLDDIIFYDRALSASDVKTLFYVNDYGVELIDLPVSTERRPTFAWHPASGASTYTIVADTAGDFTNPLFVVPLSDTTYTPAADLPYDTIYWKVSTDNNRFSSIGICVIQDARIPSIIPFDPEYIFTRKPVFRWHPVDSASSYTIVSDTSQKFAQPFLSVPVNDTAYQPAVDLPVDTIYWKVKSDLVETYSMVSRFIILADSIPLLYRFNGAHCTDNQPTFRWSTVEDATSYTIQIDTARAFSAPFIMVPVSDTTYTPAIKLSERIYFWRVSSSRNTSLFSPPDSLVIRLVRVTAPNSVKHDRPTMFRCAISRKNGTLFLTVPCQAFIGRVSVYDLHGKKIGTWEIPATSAKGAYARIPVHSRNSSGPGKGLYLIKVQYGNTAVTGAVPVAD
jgi:hypothetical protein